MERVQRFVRQRTEAVALAVVVLVVLVWANLDSPRPIPLGVHVTGLVGAAGLALPAIGIVLVYRANRVINFAQLQMGAIAGTLFMRLIELRSFVRGVGAICPPCLKEPKTVGDVLRLGQAVPGAAQLAVNPAVQQLAKVPLSDPRAADILPPGISAKELAVVTAPRWMVDLNYWLAFLLAIALTTFLVWAVYILVIKRFNQAPRLILTVVTLCAGQLALRFGNALMDVFIPARQSQLLVRGGTAIPNEVKVTLAPAVFHTAEILMVVSAVAAGVGLYAFFRYSRVGIVLRGAAENPQRAETLGVNLNAVTARAWVIAGFLSGLAAVLGVAHAGRDFYQGYDTVVRVLASAVVGGLVSLPLTIAGAFSLGIIDQAVLWATNSVELVSGLLVVIVVVLLVAQRARASRAEIDSQGAWLASRELRPIPRELRGLAPVRTAVRLSLVIAAVFVIGYPWLMSPSQVNLGVVSMLFLIVLLSLLVLTGWAGQISLAQMAFAAIGAYVAAVSHWPFVFAVPAGAVVGALVAVAVGFPALRLRGQFLAVSSLAFALAVSEILLSPRYLGKSIPARVSRPVLLGINFGDDRAFYYLTLVFVVLAVLAVMGLRRSPVARTLIACKDNEQAAQAFSLNLVRCRVAAFALSGFIAAFAGALFAYAQHGVSATSFAPERSIDMFLFAIIGGFGSVTAPIFGIVYLLLVQLLSTTVPFLQFLTAPSLGVIVLLIVAPGGLASVLYSLRDAWLRRLADRYRIMVPSLYADRKPGDTALVPIAPKLRPNGGTVFVPTRFRFARQWMVEAQKREAARG
jgi:branched-chain amino acid transport system permease protein